MRDLGRRYPILPATQPGRCTLKLGWFQLCPVFMLCLKYFKVLLGVRLCSFLLEKLNHLCFFLELEAESFVKKKESVTFREAEAGNGLCVPKNWTKSIHSGRLSDRDCHEDHQCCVLTLLGFTITRTGGVNSVNSVNLVRDKGSRVAAANGSMDAALASPPTASSSSSTSTDSTIKSCVLYHQ